MGGSGDAKIPNQGQTTMYNTGVKQATVNAQNFRQKQTSLNALLGEVFAEATSQVN